jgi:protein O-mannosyl-transferase
MGKATRERRRRKSNQPTSAAPAPSKVAPVVEAPASGFWGRPIVAAAALLGMALLAYGPVWTAGFIWDDDHYVTLNKTLHSLAGLTSIWFDRHANPQYYPLVHTTFWVEYHLWGLQPLGYHLVNVLLHAGNVVLLWILLRRLAVPGAFWAAALFAVHPVEVESVAWVTERKNVLSTFFYFGSFLAFVKFWPPEQSQPRPEGRWRWYALALVLFAAALFSKTVACSLPAAFLLVRWWKLGRLSRRDWLITAPLFALGMALAMNTAELEKEHVGAKGADWAFSFLDRILIAGRALWFYAGKLLWPEPLVLFYPRWKIDAAQWWQYLYPAAALGALIALWAMRRRWGRGPLVAVLFFAGTLFPALGFFNVYPMRYAFVADHFQYLASIGLLALAAAGSARLASEFVVDGRAATAGGVVVLLIFIHLSREQTRDFQDLSTLWNNTIAKNPECWIAYNNRADMYPKPGTPADWRAAAADYSRAIELKNDYREALGNRGNMYLRLGEYEQALLDLNRALALRPDYADDLKLRANCYHQLGRFREAIADYDRAIAQFPNKPEYLNDRGLSHLRLRDWDHAFADFNRAIEIDPTLAGAFYNRGLAHDMRFQIDPGYGADRALADFDQAFKLDPEYWEALLNRGALFLRLEQNDRALRDFNRALKINPKAAAAYNNRALANLRLGHLQEAKLDIDQAKALGAPVEPALMEMIMRAAPKTR